jgi:DNA-binding transcriptional regulator YhcF (GntR family)
MSSVAMDKVLARLHQVLDDGTSARLPSARAICLELGVSSRAYSQAIARLKAEGRVVSVRGDGVRPSGAQVQAVPPRLRWDDIAQKIKEGILEGNFPTKIDLPSPKELASEWKVHPDTVRKALRHLESEGVLLRLGRRLIPNTPGGVRKATRQMILLCIGQQAERGGLRMDGDREADVWREVQTEASRQGLAIRPVPWNGNLPNFGKEVVGAVVSTWHVLDPHDLLAALAGHKLRHCIWIENAVDLPGNRWKSHPAFRFHDIGYAHEAGVAMGRHLHDLGHKNLAWISPFHGSKWSQNRMEGVRQGFGEPVSSFVLDAPLSEWDFLAPVWDDPRSWQLSLHDFDLEWSLASDHPMSGIFEATAWSRLMKVFEPQLQAALSSGATAWVACSDLVAALCLRWLARQGESVRQRISVSGFDDTRQALRDDLTSYRFDAAAMARSMIHFLLGRDHGGGRVIRHPGQLVVRGSTRRIGA